MGDMAKTVQNITILNQTNTYQRYPDLRNKLLCQNMTDKWSTPTLEAGDDATLPPLQFWTDQGVERGLDDCSAFTFSWTTIRSKHDTTPYFITLSFWSDLSYNSTPFYKKSFQWPTNNAHWSNDPLLVPWQSEITLQLNEVGDDRVTRFNFRDGGFFPKPGELFWISFYATMRYGKSSSLRTNSMYWVLLNADSGSTPLVEIFPGGRNNNNFVYRDLTNFMGNGWVNWTDGARVEEAMKISTTRNLAFSLFFTCLVELPPPTTIPPPTSTTPVSTQTETPSMIVEVNETVIEEKGGSGKLVASILAPLLTLCCCGGFVGFLYKKWRNRKNKRLGVDLNPTTPEPTNPIAVPVEVSLFDGIEDMPVISRISPLMFSNSYSGMYKSTRVEQDSSISSDDD
jgi:hypothetical protein